MSIVGHTESARAAALARARESDYFTGARLPEELADILAQRADEAAAAADELANGVTRIYLVGSGGSFADVSAVKYTLDALVDVPVEAVASYELVWRDPRGLAPGALAAFVSLSGETEDTVAALRHARASGARTLAVVRSCDSTLAVESDSAIEFGSAACYEAPIALLTLFGARLAKRSGDAALAEEIVAGLNEIPGRVRDAMAREEPLAEAKAHRFLDSTHMAVVGAGPLSSLAYKVALTVLMENVRIAGSWWDAAEFRHGPAEALDRTRPDAMILLGTDASRPLTERVRAFLDENGARTLVYDAAEAAPGLHPLLVGLILNSLIQTFVVHSAVQRGILDLDERAFMGRRVLSIGGGQWP